MPELTFIAAILTALASGRIVELVWYLASSRLRPLIGHHTHPHPGRF